MMLLALSTPREDWFTPIENRVMTFSVWANFSKKSWSFSSEIPVFTATSWISVSACELFSAVSSPWVCALTNALSA
jgi:hypothetical protein